jgi:hypothetical protein
MYVNMPPYPLPLPSLIIPRICNLTEKEMHFYFWRNLSTGKKTRTNELVFG